MSTDLSANSVVSANFPTMPSFIAMATKGTKQSRRFRTEKDGQITALDGEERICGTWWPLSASCVQLVIDNASMYFRFDDSNTWISSTGSSSILWSRKRDRDSTSSRTSLPTAGKSRAKSPRNSPNLSRFRMGVLPLDQLDALHKEQLDCMGLRVCRHYEVGRVLVTSRRFDDGDVVLYSRVASFDVKTDAEVLEMIDTSHPSCCYLLVPRTRKLYYNKATFSDEDPIASGDLWYLVNHSNRPNVEVLLRKDGIQFKAKRVIQPNEPLVWSYPPSFFGKGEGTVDLPQNIVPDDSVYIRE